MIEDIHRVPNTDSAILSISGNDHDFMASSVYFISVHGALSSDLESMDFSVSAVATTVNSINYMLLVNDMEQVAQIGNANAEKYYSFKADHLQSVHVSLNAIEGAVSMYVTSDGQVPSDTIYDIRAENIENKFYSFNINKPCVYCSYLVSIYAKKNSVYSLRFNAVSNRDPHHEPHNIWGFVMVAIVVIIASGLTVWGCVTYRKNQKLRRELEITELELNMQGKKSAKQRREELASTTKIPAKPFSRNKKKYEKLGDNEQPFDEDIDAFNNNDMQDPIEVQFNQNL